MLYSDAPFRRCYRSGRSGIEKACQPGRLQTAQGHRERKVCTRFFFFLLLLLLFDIFVNLVCKRLCVSSLLLLRTR